MKNVIRDGPVENLRKPGHAVANIGLDVAIHSSANPSSESGNKYDSIFLFVPSRSVNLIRRIRIFAVHASGVSVKSDFFYVVIRIRIHYTNVNISNAKMALQQADVIITDHFHTF